MTTKNDITGDSIKSKINNKKYRDNWDIIFNNKQKTEKKESERNSTVKDGENTGKD
jgi:hypothetical protein